MSIMAVIYLAGGCFWGVEEYFSRIPGVLETSVGYAQSRIADPDYHQVCSGATGAAETVRVVFNPRELSLQTLLDRYFRIIDPFAVNRQGNDSGTQYRTGVYYEDPSQKAELEKIFREREKTLGRPMAVELQPLVNFYPAEEYHQKYLKKNPGGYCHINFDSLKDLPQQSSKPEKFQMPDDASLRRMLTPEEYHITRENGTEAPFTGRYWNNHEAGIYVDPVSGEALFASSAKFDSGSGWPSFTRPINPEAITHKVDHSHGMTRVEVRSSLADSHLGHVFNDGPDDRGGLRYCINSAALRFIPLDKMDEAGYGALKHLVTEP